MNRPLHIVYPELPPSSNKIYFRGTILTRKAREYAERFQYYVTRNYLHLINQLRVGETTVFTVGIHFYFEELTNKSWHNPKVPEKKRAQTRYKKLDLSNRVKLLEDCIRDSLGIDDSLTFEMHTLKSQDPKNPRVEIFVSESKPTDYGIPNEEEVM